MDLKSKVIVDGKTWHLFSVEFQSPDGKFSAYFYAIDAEHASYQLEAMKANGVVCNIACV